MSEHVLFGGDRDQTVDPETVVRERFMCHPQSSQRPAGRVDENLQKLPWFGMESGLILLDCQQEQSSG